MRVVDHQQQIASIGSNHAPLAQSRAAQCRPEAQVDQMAESAERMARPGAVPTTQRARLLLPSPDMTCPAQPLRQQRLAGRRVAPSTTPRTDPDCRRPPPRVSRRASPILWRLRPTTFERG